MTIYFSNLPDTLFLSSIGKYRIIALQATRSGDIQVKLVTKGKTKKTVRTINTIKLVLIFAEKVSQL